MAGPFDVVCILHNEKTGRFAVGHFIEGEGWTNPNRTTIMLHCPCIEGSTTYELACEFAIRMGRHFGLSPDNVITAVVYPSPINVGSPVTWTAPNWRSPPRPFTKVFPGRSPPVSRDGWGQLLADDDFG